MTVRYPTIILLAGIMMSASACFLHRHSQGAAGEPTAAATADGGADQQSSTDQEAQASPEATPQAGAKIQILYTHSGDYLTSLMVTKYSAAALLRTRATSNGKVSVVRFDGGQPVWKIEVDRGFSSLLSPVPGIDENKKFALSDVTYGVLPKNFLKDLPEMGDPEPLQPNFYYIFSVNREIGPASYQAVYVAADGAIEGYDAQPLIGTSYELCCSLSPDFANPAPADSVTNPDGSP